MIFPKTQHQKMLTDALTLKIYHIFCVGHIWMILFANFFPDVKKIRRKSEGDPVLWIVPVKSNKKSVCRDTTEIATDLH